VSLLQLARSYMIFARDGDIIPLSFQKVNEKPVGQQVISPKTAPRCAPCSKRVVGPDGTASQAQVAGYRVGGKTGTAQKVVNGRYSRPRKYIGSFVGIAPMSNPRFIIAVMIDEPTRRCTPAAASPRRPSPRWPPTRCARLNVPPDSSVTDIIIPAPDSRRSCE
jgi:cell division protein FtsI (penicillin-binding protein 3)